MSILRVMTYALKGASTFEATSIAHIIALQRPELVFLQYLPDYFLESLAKETGLKAYAGQGTSGFLSCHSLSAIQSRTLGRDGDCTRADLNLSGKRLHLFNLKLSMEPTRRREQISRLFGEDLLGANLPCATLVAGDFGLPLWGSGQWLLRRRLSLVKHPTWGANYPAAFPICPRGRFYLRGPIRSLAGQVVSIPEFCRGSQQLPVVSTLELTDTRIYLKVPEVLDQQMQPVTG